jgi:hypothetical protein
MSGREIGGAGRRKPPASARPRRKVGPAVPGRPLTHRYRDFDDHIALGAALDAWYLRAVAIIEAFDAEDRPPPPGVNARAWQWSEVPEARLKRRRALEEAAEALLFRFSAEELDEAVKEFERGWRFFERDDVFEGPSDHRVLSIEFITSRVALLIGGFPSGSPASPEVFTRMMIEEVCCLEASASRVELAVKTLLRAKTFLPSIAEVLAAIRATHMATWGEGGFETDEGEVLLCWARRSLAKAVAAAKAAPRLPPPEVTP